MDASRTAPGAALVLGSCLSLQFGAALATQLFPALGPWGVTALRLSIAALILMLVVRPRLLRWDRRQWRAVVLFGAALAGMNGLFYAAIARIPLGTAVAVEFLGPLVLAAVLSRRARDWLWITLALTGMGLLGLESALTAAVLDPAGALLALGAGAFWAAYVLTSAQIGRVVPGQGGLAAALLVSAAIIAPIGAPGAFAALTDPLLLALAIGTALLASVIPYSLELAALRRLPSSVFSILLSLEPAIAAAAGWLLLGQEAGPLGLVAVALVVAASMGTTLGQPRTQPPQPRTRSESQTSPESQPPR